MEDQSKTEYGLLNLKAGNIFSNMYSSHLPNFRSDFSAFQNWRDCFKRNSEEFHKALEDLKTGELWDARIPNGKSQNTDYLPGPKCDKRSMQGLHSPSSLGQCLPAFAPVFAGLMNRRRRRENRPRRQRTTFSSDQTVKLEIEYSRTEYITRSRRYELAEMLCLTENQIKIWFQNRRAKEKRIEKAHMDHHLRTLSITGHPGSYSIPKCPNGDLGEASSWPESPPISKPKHM